MTRNELLIFWVNVKHLKCKQVKKIILLPSLMS